MKKAVLLLLVASLVLTIIPVISMAEEEVGTIPWPAERKYLAREHYSDRLRMRFRPLDNYTCEQNPPDFSWWNITEAKSYDLIVSRDPELTDRVYEIFDLSTCYYNFPEPFEPGVYYWSVRFRTISGLSVWQPARRFLVEDDAFLFPVQDVSDTVTESAAKGHPRYYVDRESLPIWREKAQKEGELKDMVQKNIDITTTNLTEPPLDTERTYTWGQGGVANANIFWREVDKGHSRMLAACFAYIMTGDRSIGTFGVGTLMKMLEFELPPFDANTDTYICIFAMNLAIYYDSLYELLTPDQRTAVLEKIGKTVDSAEKLFRMQSFLNSPQLSHEWNCGRYLLVASLLTSGEVEGSEEKANYLLSYYINQTSPHQIEDGGYKGGIGYFRFQSAELENYMDRSGVIRMWTKAFYANRLYFLLYMYPAGSIGAFGDDSFHPVDHYSAGILYNVINYDKNPVAKWALEQVGVVPSRSVSTFYFDDFSDVEALPPVHLPRAKYFKDTGYAGLHSDLIDKERVSLFFRSSWYGSYNHSHNDNNSFMIQAYGEPLAIDSGFYPYYDSPHHEGYARQTFAHNAITFNGGRGQPTGDIEASGKITGFVTHRDFDYVGGDATESYKDGRGGEYPVTIGKAKRHIIFLRPETFIVVDDLAALPNETASFEFWLQAEEQIEVYKSKKGARLTKSDAVLDAKVQYPSAVTAKYLEGYMGPNLVENPPEIKGDISNTLDPNAPTQRRVYFSTQPVSKTKMITTLDVHRKNEGIANIVSESFADYMKLSFEDGSIAYVKTSDVAEITADNITFTGVAAVKKDNSVMLVEGTSLVVDGIEIFKSETPISAVLGKEEMSLSSLENDTQITVYHPNLKSVVEVRDEKVREIAEGKRRNGVEWNTNGDYAEFKLYNGTYHFYLNDVVMPGTPMENSSLKLEIDGEEREIPARNYIDHDGNITGDVSLTGVKGLYYVEEANGIKIYTSKQIVSIFENQTFSINSASPTLKLHSMPIDETEEITDFNKMKEDSAVYVEAENYRELSSISTVSKTTEAVYSFLSGGRALQDLHQAGDMATYDIEIPADGTYDILINNVVYNSEVDSNMCLVIDGKTSTFVLPLTNGPNGPNIARGTSVWGVQPKDWHVIRVKSGIELRKGKYEMSLLGLGGGLTKFDWIGLIESDK